MQGIYLISKPKGITSHDVVDYLRKVTGEKTIGHAGTLDPLATGLMIVAIGREFTKKISQFSKLDKEYVAEATLGATSTTYDAEGVVISSRHPGPTDRRSSSDSGSRPRFRLPLGQRPARAGGGGRNDREEIREDSSIPNVEKIESVLQNYIGQQNQMPPIFSAKKIKGQKAYDLARQGKEVELKAVPVNIYDIKLINYQYPILKFSTKVSSGTYIRSLVHDIGQKLGAGAYMSGLIRTAIGNYQLTQAIDLQQIKSLSDLYPLME